MTIQAIARITPHPTDPNVAIIIIGHEHNRLFAAFPSATLDTHLGGYLIHHDAIPGLHRFANHTGIHLIDQRPTTPSGARPVPQECWHCGQPGSWAHPPAHCPDCGKPWDPAQPPDHGRTTGAHTRCPECGKPQHGRFPRCADCGAHLDHGPATTRPLIPATPRAHLDDPLPLADVLSDHTPHPQDPA